jgi:hypothetical protein
MASPASSGAQQDTRPCSPQYPISPEKNQSCFHLRLPNRRTGAARHVAGKSYIQSQTVLRLDFAMQFHRNANRVTM